MRNKTKKGEVINRAAAISDTMALPTPSVSLLSPGWGGGGEAEE